MTSDPPPPDRPAPALRLIAGGEGDGPALQDAADWLILLREEPENAGIQERFERWLDADPAHVRAWAAVGGTFDLLGAVPAAPQPALRRRCRWWAMAAVAAGLALALVPEAAIRVRADVRTGIGEVGSATLPDGSRVRLGPGSAIDVRYGEGARAVRLLAGTAWFDVRRDPARPFRVDAGAINATVLGTAFEMRLAEAQTDVTVVRGRVRVSDRGAPSPLVRDLGAGEWASIADDHRAAFGTTDPAMVAPWRLSRVVAHSRTIADMIDEIRPWYRGRIVLTDAALGQKQVDGVYDPADPARALAALVDPHGGAVTRITPWLILVGSR